MVIWGDGSAIRDFAFARDVLLALFKLYFMAQRVNI